MSNKKLAVRKVEVKQRVAEDERKTSNQIRCSKEKFKEHKSII
jgi:hypothetical protein